MTKIKIERELLYALIIAIGFTIFAYYPALFKGLYISGDSRIQLFYLHMFRDPGLFAGWEIVDIFFKHYLPQGFILVFFILNKFVDLYTITLIMPFFYNIVVVLMAYFIAGFFINNKLLKFSMASFFMLLYNDIDLGRGAAIRAMGIPLVLIFLFFSLRKQKIAQYMTVLISWWFYPIVVPIFLLTITLDVIAELRNRLNPEKLKYLVLGRHLVFLVLVVLNATPLLLSHPVSFLSNDKRLEVFLNLNEMRKMEELGPEGAEAPVDKLQNDLKYILSLEFIYDQLLYIDEYDKNKIGLWPCVCLFLLLTAYFFNIIKVKNFGKISRNSLMIIFIILIQVLIIISIYLKVAEPYGCLIWGLLTLVLIQLILYRGRIFTDSFKKLFFLFCSSMAIFLIAYIIPYEISYALHFPARQLALVLSIFLSIFVFHNFSYLQKSEKMRFANTICGVLMVLIAFVYLNKYDAHLSHAKDESLYVYLSSLPKSIVVAGHPLHMNFIPFFAKRQVFVFEELSPLGGGKYWTEIKKRTFEVLDAFYSRDGDEFVDFCRKYEKDDVYFVVDKLYFTAEYLNGREYWQPFKDYIKRITKEKKFFLSTIDKKWVCFEDKDLFVINCREYYNNHRVDDEFMVKKNCLLIGSLFLDAILKPESVMK